MWEFVVGALKEISKEVAAYLIIAIAGSIGVLAMLRKSWNWLCKNLCRGGSSEECERKLERARTSVARDGKGLWLTIQPKAFADYESLVQHKDLKVLMIANLKGGVGKTTIAANLGAYFANPHGAPDRPAERVLLIDFDFQGSLSSMALPTTQRIPVRGEVSRAARLLLDEDKPAKLISLGQPVKGLEVFASKGREIYFDALPSYYDLAAIENELMVKWLIDDYDGRDIRYNLARFITSNDVRECYDRIIIDAPPRLSTAHVQALCASTHVLIPTVLDPLSGEAVGTFVRQIIDHRFIAPHVQITGVVGTMVDRHWSAPDDGSARDGPDYLLNADEALGRKAVETALEQVKDDLGLRQRPTGFLPRSSFIKDLTTLSKAAGQRIAYLDPGDNPDTRTVRATFDRLGDEVRERMRS